MCRSDELPSLIKKKKMCQLGHYTESVAIKGKCIEHRINCIYVFQQLLDKKHTALRMQFRG